MHSQRAWGPTALSQHTGRCWDGNAVAGALIGAGAQQRVAARPGELLPDNQLCVVLGCGDPGQRLRRPHAVCDRHRCARLPARHRLILLGGHRRSAKVGQGHRSIAGAPPLRSLHRRRDKCLPCACPRLVDAHALSGTQGIPYRVRVGTASCQGAPKGNMAPPINGVSSTAWRTTTATCIFSSPRRWCIYPRRFPPVSPPLSSLQMISFIARA